MKNVTKPIFAILFFLASIPAFAQFTWVSQASGTSQDLNGIWANGPLAAYVVGDNGVARRTTNGGTTWTTMNLGSTLTHNRIRFNGVTGFMVGAGQEVLQTTNAGSSWSSIGIGITTLHDFFFTGGAGGWVVGDQEVGYGFLYNTLTSQLFQSPAIQNKVLRGIHFTNTVNGFVVGDGGLLLRTFNNGSTWIQSTSGTSRQLNKITFVNPTTGIIVGNNGIILKTIDSGSTWTSLSSGTSTNLNAVYFPDPNNIFVCGNNGTILFSNNGGQTWQTETTNTSHNLNSIHGDGISNIWACGDNGTILYRTQSTGISEALPTSLNSLVYPNPATNHATFVLSGAPFKNFTGSLNIYNTLGQLVRTQPILGGQTEKAVSTADLSSGTYAYKLVNKTGEIINNGKFVVER